jgi:hypothetical protein
MDMKKKTLFAIAGGGLSLALAAVAIGGLALRKPANHVDAATVTWNRVTSISAGDVVTLAAEGATTDSAGSTCTGAYLTGFSSGFDTTQAKNFGKGTSGTFSSGSFSASDALELTVVTGSATSSYAFKCTSGGTDYYISAVNGNYLNLVSSVANASSWTLTVDSTNVKLYNVSQTTRYIQWNNSSPRFAAYISTQTNVQLYKKGASISVTGITGVAAKPASILQNATLSASDVTLSAIYSDNSTGTVTATSVTCVTSAVGTVTATAYYDTFSATFSINVYAAHDGLSASTAFTCEEAIAHTKAADLTAATTYFVTGLWYSTYSAYNTSYGNASVYLCDAVTDPASRRFEAYKMYSIVAPGTFTQSTSVTVYTAGSNFTVYNGTYETKQCLYLDPDFSALDTFVSTYMHTEVAYTEAGTGLCTSSGWYSAAKTAYTALSARQQSTFSASSTAISLYTAAGGIDSYSAPHARYVAWAAANGETASAFDVSSTNNSTAMIAVAIVTVLGLLTLAGVVVLKKKHN